jgi:cyclophilin family peptidyl-prolyl cis-trans isomerase
MSRILLALSLFGASSLAALADNPKVSIETNMGQITLELDAEKAPGTVQNFLRYVDEGFYDGTIFHRVIDGFMIQGGGFTPELERKETHGGIKNEADNGLQNVRGSVAMARTSQPHSASSQFFINLVDNGFLNHREKNRRGWGYAVFGKVTSGMDVVDKIGKLTTTTRPNGMSDVPIETVVIERVARID